MKTTNEKNVLTANQMIGELIQNIVLFGIIFFLIYRIIYTFIGTLFTESNYILFAFIIIVLQAIMITIVFKISNKRVFKQSTIYKSDVLQVMKIISFIVIVILVLQVINTLGNLDSVIDEAINEDFSLQYREHLLSLVYDDGYMEKYKEEKEKAIQEAKKKMYAYVSIMEIGTCIVYGITLFLEKRALYDNAIEKAE